MTTNRLGVVFETLAIVIFGIIFGCMVNWQLTIIIFAPLGILFIACLVQDHSYKQMRKKCNGIIEEASRVSYDFP